MHVHACVRLCTHTYIYTHMCTYIYACVFNWGCFSEVSVSLSDSAVQMRERLVQPHDNRTPLLGRSSGGV